MSKYFGKGIPVAAGFDLNAKAPLDARTVAVDLEQLNSMPDIQRYDGLTVYVEAEQRNYQLIDGEWQRMSTSSDVDSAIKGQIIDSLTSDSSEAALSARQGKVLKGLIDANAALIQEQGTEIEEHEALISGLDTAIKANKASIDTNKASIQAQGAKIATIESVMAEQEAAIQANEAGIAENKTEIATNKNSIAAHKLLIDSNKESIDAHAELIETNKAGIESNKTLIQANKVATQTNKTAIDANKALIDENKLEIATNKLAVEANKTSIAENKALIQANTASIEEHQTSIEEQQALIEANKVLINEAKSLIAEHKASKVDGEMHVPATGTTNNGKILKAGASAGEFAWAELSFAELAGKPTTLAGYGITDAAPKVQTNDRLTAIETAMNVEVSDEDVEDIIDFIKQA